MGKKIFKKLSLTRNPLNILLKKFPKETRNNSAQLHFRIENVVLFFSELQGKFALKLVSRFSSFYLSHLYLFGVNTECYKSSPIC